MHKLIITYFLLLFPLIVLAQPRDYLLLHQGDTLFGEYLPRNSINKGILFRTKNTIKIPPKDVKQVYWKNVKYWIYEDPCEGSWELYRVIVEGKVSYLNTGGYEDYCPDLVIINNEIYPIIRKDHFSEEVWGILSKCPAFEEKYGAFYNENLDKTIVWEWAYRQSRTKLAEMIRYYNANCKTPTK